MSDIIDKHAENEPEYKPEIEVRLIPYGNHFMFPVQHRHHYEGKVVNIMSDHSEVQIDTERIGKIRAVAKEIISNSNAEFHFKLEHSNQLSLKRHEMAMEMGFQGYSEALIEQAFQLGCNLKVVLLLDGKSEFVRCGYVEVEGSKQYSRLDYSADFPTKYLVVSQNPKNPPSALGYNMVARVRDSIDNLETL